MKTLPTIRINEGKTNCKSFLFPDKQPHFQLASDTINDLTCPDGVQVIAPLRNSEEVMNLLMLCNALDHAFVKKAVLVIPYLLAARSDRVMQTGDAVGLEVVAELINSCNFERVNLFDAHSDVAPALIKRSKNHNNSLLVKAYDKKEAVLIIPDAGAAKKVTKYLEWNPNIKDIVQCVKSRDLADKGKVSLTVLEPDKCFGKNCVIIDDLCDGGGTFNMIADNLRTQGFVPKSLTLITSHGIFSKGFAELAMNFDEIIVSDSFATTYDKGLCLSAPGMPNPLENLKLTVVPIFSKL